MTKPAPSTHGKTFSASTEALLDDQVRGYLADNSRLVGHRVRVVKDYDALARTCHARVDIFPPGAALPTVAGHQTTTLMTL